MALSRNIITTLTRRGQDDCPSPSLIVSSSRTLVIVSSVLGVTNAATLVVLVYVLLRYHRRIDRRSFHDADRSRSITDYNFPYDLRRRRQLSWSRFWPWLRKGGHVEIGLGTPPYSPYSPYSRSGSAQDAETQRRDIIRKSLQSRTSVNNVQSASPTTLCASPDDPALSSPALPRNPTSTRHTPTLGAGATEQQPQQQSGRGGGEDELLQAQARARVDHMWCLLNSRGHQPRMAPTSASSQGGEAVGYRDAPTLRPPTVRLKTPPLLSHPAFRGGRAVGDGGERGPGPKHSSLPTELTRIYPTRL